TTPACRPCCRAAPGGRCARCAATAARVRCCALRTRSRSWTCRKRPSTSIRRKTSARGAVDPAGLAARVILFLPDRHARFGLVDDVATRVERGAAMPRRDPDPHRAVADRELADAMLAKRSVDRKPLLRFGQDLRALFLGNAFVRLVFERLNGFAVVVIADPAFERHARTGGALHELALARFGVDRHRRDLEGHEAGLSRR